MKTSESQMKTSESQMKTSESQMKTSESQTMADGRQMEDNEGQVSTITVVYLLITNFY